MVSPHAADGPVLPQRPLADEAELVEHAGAGRVAHRDVGPHLVEPERLEAVAQRRPRGLRGVPASRPVGADPVPELGLAPPQVDAVELDAPEELARGPFEKSRCGCTLVW